MKYEIGTRWATIDPATPGIFGDWRAEGRLCTIVRLHGPHDGVVRFDDGNGWDGPTADGPDRGCWNIGFKYLMPERDAVGFEVDA